MAILISIDISNDRYILSKAVKIVQKMPTISTFSDNLGVYILRKQNISFIVIKIEMSQNFSSKIANLECVFFVDAVAVEC